jgi:hypothetical protein
MIKFSFAMTAPRPIHGLVTMTTIRTEILLFQRNRPVNAGRGRYLPQRAKNRSDCRGNQIEPLKLVVGSCQSQLLRLARGRA